MPDIRDKVTLYCKEGGADKQYTCWLEAQGGGWTVQFQFGPRGGWLQGGTKTKAPIGLDEAQKIYQKILKEKRAKGYVEGEDAPSFSQTPEAVDSGVRPMLLTAAEESDIDKYVADDAWAGQEKKNGKRILLKAGAEVVGVNRRGLECPIPEDLAKAVRGANMLFDGELIGTVYHVFDLLAEGPDFSADHRKEILGHRWGKMDAAVRALKSDLVQPVPLAEGTPAKRKLVEQLRAGRKEGIVFKLLHGVYVPGRIDNLGKSLAVKVKFWAEGSFLVMKWTKGKSSVLVGLVDPKTGDAFSAGSVTVPAKYVEQVREGGVVRVRYLYATEADQLYQPALDPDDNGSVVADGKADRPGTLKHEGKDE